VAVNFLCQISSVQFASYVVKLNIIITIAVIKLKLFEIVLVAITGITIKYYVTINQETNFYL